MFFSFFVFLALFMFSRGRQNRKALFAAKGEALCLGPSGLTVRLHAATRARGARLASTSSPCEARGEASSWWWARELRGLGGLRNASMS